MVRTKLNIAYLVITLIWCLPLQAQVWHNVGNAGFSVGTANYTSLVFYTSGKPMVAYQDGANGYKVTVMRYEGNSWVPMGNVGFSAGKAYYIQLVMSNTGVPYICFQDGANGDKATVMRYNGNAWENVGNPGFSAGQAYYTSLAIDNNGTPYVAYQDFGDSSKATVMKFNGNAWQVVGTQGFSAGEADYTAIAINSLGDPYVVYEDFDISNRITVMKYNGSAWVQVGIQGFSANTVSYTTIAIDKNDTPYVAFNQTGANVFKYNGAQWVQVGFPQFSGQESFTSMAIADSGLIYVGGSDRRLGGKAFVSVYDTSFLQTFSSVGSSASTGSVNYTSIAISKSGVPHIAYSDELNGFRASLMEFSVVSGIGDEVLVDDVRVYPNPSEGRFSIVAGRKGSFILANALGQVVKIDNVIANEPYIIDHLPQGFYLLKLGSSVRKIIVAQ